jgi:hypothetical protein
MQAVLRSLLQTQLDPGAGRASAPLPPHHDIEQWMALLTEVTDTQRHAELAQLQGRAA